MLNRKAIMRVRRKGIRSAREIARRLGYRSRRMQLEVQKILLDAGIPQRRCWTKEELALLRHLYPSTQAAAIAERLKRTTPAVYGQANKMDLRPLTIRGGFPKGTHFNPAGEFVKGQTPWNKGKKVGSYPGSVETQFKKGHAPKNTLFDGAVTVRTDWKDPKQRKYQWIRLGLHKWKELHRLVWEHHHGRIPRGHIVVFADGDTMNCRPENLRCISRVQHAANTRNKDEYIAKCLAAKTGGKGNIDRDLYRRILKNPKLIEAKRRQLQLKRELEKPS